MLLANTSKPSCTWRKCRESQSKKASKLGRIVMSSFNGEGLIDNASKSNFFEEKKNIGVINV